MAFTFPTDTNNKAGAVRQNPGGTGFHVPTVIYDKDGVTPITTSQAGSEIIRWYERPSLSPKMRSDYKYYPYPVILDSVIWTTNGKVSMSIDIEVFNRNEWRSISEIYTHSRADAAVPATPQNILDYPSGEWEIITFDTNRRVYTLKNRNPIYLPGGQSRISFYNHSPDTQLNVQFKIIGRRV